MTKAAQLVRVAPVLPVRDVGPAAEYYERCLGFVRGYVNADGDLPVYAILIRDGVAIHLKLDRTGASAGTGGCHFMVTDADALHLEYLGREARIVKDLETHAYGLKDFIVADLDGNRLDFGSPLGQP